jgi:hypothetical protein
MHKTYSELRSIKIIEFLFYGYGDGGLLDGSGGGLLRLDYNYGVCFDHGSLTGNGIGHRENDCLGCGNEETIRYGYSDGDGNIKHFYTCFDD